MAMLSMFQVPGYALVYCGILRHAVPLMPFPVYFISFNHKANVEKHPKYVQNRCKTCQ
jgi:hypothetical protein